MPGIPVLLDGGLATQLEAQGNRLDTVLWSADLLHLNPGEIVRAHRAYLEAGSDVLTSASYQGSRAGFNQVGIDSEHADELLVSSVALARQAIVEHAQQSGDDRKRMVAASIGPYGAVLSDGSEYTGDYGVGSQVLGRFHKPRLALLDGAGADYLAVETIPSMPEAAVLANLLAGCDTPAWVAFSCRDGTSLCDGTPISVAASAFRDVAQVFALGINCTAPQHAASLIREIRHAVPDKSVVVYPNSGESYDARTGEWHGYASPDEFVAAAAEWLDEGADYIGGCCRVGPEHIRALRELIDGRGSRPA